MTDKLKELALAANVIDHNENRGWYEADMLLLDGVYYPKNARFIAAASPDVVLALIEDLEKHRALLLKHIAVIDPLKAEVEHLTATLYKERAEHEAEVERLKAQEPVAWMTHTNSLLPLFHRTKAAALDYGADPKPLFASGAAPFNERNAELWLTKNKLQQHEVLAQAAPSAIQSQYGSEELQALILAKLAAPKEVT
jgi:hypothetical protein